MAHEARTTEVFHLYEFAQSLSATLLVGVFACAVVFDVAAWRRLGKSLLIVGPWLLFVGALLSWQVHQAVQYIESATHGHSTPELDASVHELPGRVLPSMLFELAITAAFAVAGLEACRRSGRRGLPATRRLARERDPPGPGTRRWLGETLTLTAGAVAWSLLFFRLTGYVPVAGSIANPGFPSQAWVLFTVPPVTEELMYRLGVQNILMRLMRGRAWAIPVAVLASALFWTIGHEHGVRVVQIMPIGLALGWLQLRHGTEACMVAHGGLNAAMLGLHPILWPS